MALEKGTVPDVQNVQALSAQDVIDAKTALALQNVDNTSDANKPVSTAQQAALDDKVDKVAGKGLSDENYTLSEKNKLSGVEDGATANATDIFLLNRSNHTGTQSSETVTNQAVDLGDVSTNIDIGFTIPSQKINLISNIVLASAFTPLEGFSKVVSRHITTQTGVETLSLPADWNVYGEFDPSTINLLTVEISNYSFLNVVVNCFINQPNP